jgi:hypothetical protein
MIIIIVLFIPSPFLYKFSVLISFQTPVMRQVKKTAYFAKESPHGQR